MIADRVSQIDTSGIRKVFDLAKNLSSPVNLSIGQPHFDIPDNIKMAGSKYLQEGFNQYTQTQGIGELREALIDRIQKQLKWKPEDILITSGVSGAIFLSFMAILNPGDEIIIPDPYFVMYKHLAKLLGAKPVFVDTYPDFQITAEKIEPLIGPRTKMIVLNAPSNPTGTIISEEALKDIATLAKEKNILVLSDEIYDAFSYDQACPSIARYLDNTLLLSGFSKTYAMTGWRIGYAAGPAFIIQAMTKLQQYTFVCAPSVAQKMALEAIQTDISSYINEYRNKRDLIYNELKAHFKLIKPKGAFYIFPEAPGRDAEGFVNKAIANNVLIIPGNVFSEKNTHFRISFAASHDTIQKGMDILIKIAHDK